METNVLFRLKQCAQRLLSKRGVCNFVKISGKSRVRILALVGILLCTQAAWSISVTPSPSTDGNYTVTWSSPLGCQTIPEYFIQICFSLQERVGSGGWSNVSASGSSKTYTGKAAGTYSYQIYAVYSGMANGTYVAEGPVSVEVTVEPVCETVMIDMWGGIYETGWWQTSPGTCWGYVPLNPSPAPWYDWQYNSSTGQYENCIIYPSYAGQFPIEVCN